MRFLLPGGHGAHNLERFGIDDGHRLVELGGDIELAAGPIVNRAMGPHAVAKIHLAGDGTAGNIDHHHFVAVGSRLTHTRAAVNGHVGGPAIRGGGYLVARDAPFGHGGELLGSHRVDDAKVAVTLVGGHQHRLCRRFGNCGGVDNQQCNGQRPEQNAQEKIHVGKLIHGA